MNMLTRLLTACLMCFAFSVSAEVITPSDAEIFGILAAANRGEIQSAELAGSKATHPEIKGFAQQMLADHTVMHKDSQTLAAKLGLKSEDSTTSKMLIKKSQSDLKKLKELQGTEFDQEYLGDEVLIHKLVLETIENVLVKSADNAELKTLLTQAQAKVSAHLEHARQLKQKYGK